MNRKSNYHALFHWKDFRLQLFAEGIIVGLFAGGISVAFRYLLEKSDTIREKIYASIMSSGYAAIIMWFVLLVVAGLILGKIVKIEPMSKGSGIPDVEGILAGHLKMKWWRVILTKFAGGVLAIGAGLSLGREGPSVQLGAAAGQGVSRILGRHRAEERYLMTSGASAGLAAAFNAPLAGVIFALEELHKNFSPAVLMSAMAASLTAAFVTQQAFGVQPVFNFPVLNVFPLKYYLYLIGLGVLCGAFGVLFNKTLLKTLDLYDRLTWLPKGFVPVIPLIIGGILGFFLPQTLGGGNRLIEAISHGNFALNMLLALVAVKFLFTMASYGSGVPGGIFLPLLVVGALTGDIYGHVAIGFMHLDNQYIVNFIILAMAAYFTAIVKAPVTGSILITEMTGSFQHLLALITVSMIAYVTSDLLKGKPVYEELLARNLAKRRTASPAREGEEKVITEVAVCSGSKLDGRLIKNIVWPEDCLLISVKRGASEIIPKGNTKLVAGDYLYVLSSERLAAKTQEDLLLMAGECGIR